jgi:hypothetical protein
LRLSCVFINRKTSWKRPSIGDLRHVLDGDARVCWLGIKLQICFLGNQSFLKSFGRLALLAAIPHFTAFYAG